MSEREQNQNKNPNQTEIKTPFFKYDKNLSQKIRSGNFIRPHQLNVFNLLIERLDQGGSFISGGVKTVEFTYDKYSTLVSSASRFSELRKDLIQRNIIKVEKNVRFSGRGAKRKAIEMKRYSRAYINHDYKSWIPYDDLRQGNQLTLVATSLKAKISNEEMETNPLFQTVANKNHNPKLAFIIMNSELVCNHYIPTYGLRVVSKIAEAMNIDYEKTTQEDINKFFFAKSQAEWVQQIGQQRHIYSKRHTSIHEDYIYMEKAYIESAKGNDCSDPYRSLLYRHRNRMYNMHGDFPVIERVRRNIRYASLQQGFMIINKADTDAPLDYYQDYNRNMYSTVIHHKPLPIKDGVNTATLTKGVTLNNIHIPEGEYPVAQWQFGKDKLIYPAYQHEYTPVQLFNGKVYKTQISDISDQVLHYAKSRGDIVVLSEKQVKEAQALDSFNMGMIRAFNPDYEFKPYFNNMDSAEGFYQSHALNLVRLYDANLISEDDLDIGMQILRDEAMALPCNTLDRKIPFHHIHQGLSSTYSQIRTILPIFDMSMTSQEGIKKLFVVEPHRTAFKSTAELEYINNRFSKKISEMLELKDKRSYIDPIVTYIESIHKGTYPQIEITQARMDKFEEAFIRQIEMEEEARIERQQMYYDYTNQTGITKEEFEQIHKEAPPIDYGEAA